jgi:uncharacterized protein (TIRG00374 family)
MNKKRAMATVIVVAVLAGLAYLQFRTWRNFQWQVFWDQTSDARPLKLVIGVLVIYVTYYLRAMRWRVLLRPVKDVPTSRLVSAMIIGFTGVAILGRPGDLIRPYLIAKKESLTFSSQFAVLAVERIFDIGCFALLLILDLLLAPSLRDLPYYSEFRTAGVLLCVVVALLALVAFLIWRNTEAVSSWMEKRLHRWFPSAAKNVCERIQTFGDGLKTIHGVSSFLQLMGLSTLIWLLIAVAYVQVAHAYPAPLRHMNISHVLLLMSASIAGSLLQLPVVGGGSQLGTIAVLTEVFDVNDELAASAGIMLWLVTFVAIVPIGFLLARREHVSLRKLSEEANPEVAASGQHG